MWMLVRDNAVAVEADGSRTLAACPDSDDRGEQWRWSVRTTAGREVLVDTDDRHVSAERNDYAGGVSADLRRAAGAQLVIAAVSGEALVTDLSGPWRRWLRQGDVFVVEGEESEQLRLTLTPGDSRATVVSLTPVGDRPLRWVP